MLSGNFSQGRTTSITKSGIKSTPSFTKLSFSDFLSAYSSGKFFCIMLFKVTLEKRKTKNIKTKYYRLHMFTGQYQIGKGSIPLNGIICMVYQALQSSKWCSQFNEIFYHEVILSSLHTYWLTYLLQKTTIVNNIFPKQFKSKSVCLHSKHTRKMSLLQ